MSKTPNPLFWKVNKLKLFLLLASEKQQPVVPIPLEVELMVGTRELKSKILETKDVLFKHFISPDSNFNKPLCVDASAKVV